MEQNSINVDLTAEQQFILVDDVTFRPHNSVDIMSADMQISIVVVLVHISHISPVPIGFRNHHALILKIINAIK